MIYLGLNNFRKFADENVVVCFLVVKEVKECSLFKICGHTAISFSDIFYEGKQIQRLLLASLATWPFQKGVYIYVKESAPKEANSFL